MSVLSEILAHKRNEVRARRKKGLTLPGWDLPPIRSFRDAITKGPGVAVIAEVKKASPSKGLICPDFDHLAIACDYERGGAAAVSVLTDERFFQGDLMYLAEIRREIGLPLLRKDFIIDHFQVEESLAWGADAVLLIAAALDEVLLSELMHHVKELGMDYLLEVHDERELERAMKVGADLLGVNNRNLADFSVSIETTFRLKRIVGDLVPIVSESGISSAADMERLRTARVSAALIGEAIVKAEDRVARLEGLVAAGKG
ncbi:MAG: indole-3-glycerol phosphate synthase TrpC [Deltaproteobacteria bacterium]